jgi:Cys-tRNA synthase (O-phospho-L-seryl-tRNA:Cys-tRNA synthase)
VSDEIRIQCDRVLKRFNDIMQGESHILNSLAKEKERNAFLENELSKRDFRTITSGKTDTLHR